MNSDEIKHAMQNFLPIEYEGKKYQRIQAYIYRVIKNNHTGRYNGIFQVELLDMCGSSVVIAPTDKIKLYEEARAE